MHANNEKCFLSFKKKNNENAEKKKKTKKNAIAKMENKKEKVIWVGWNAREERG